MSFGHREVGVSGSSHGLAIHRDRDQRHWAGIGLARCTAALRAADFDSFFLARRFAPKPDDPDDDLGADED